VGSLPAVEDPAPAGLRLTDREAFFAAEVFAVSGG
jgi:hypothetical protein